MSTLTNPNPTVDALPTRPARRHWTLRQISLVIVLIGLLITGYLSYTRLANTSIVCMNGSSACDIVNSSVWAKFMGIPVAYLGFGVWAIFAAVLLLEPHVKVLRDYGYMIVFGIAVFAFAYHCYLTTMSITRIQVICQWCIMAHTTMGVMLLVAGRRLYVNLNGTNA